MSRSYKTVLGALSKYPMPIFSGKQTTFLEGVGDCIAVKFNEMIQNRQKEFEDGLFQILLLKNQQTKSGKKVKISEEARSFAGFFISEDELESVSQMNLNEYLKKKDLDNFKASNGISEQVIVKKRKRNEMSKEDSEGEDGDEDAEMEDLTGEQPKKQLYKGKPGMGFLDVGSVSWSMLLACYFLSLHDDRKSFYITLASIKEMLAVLK